MIKITVQNFLNFLVKFGNKVEICWKLEELNRDFLNNSEVSSVICWDIYYFSERLRCRLSKKISKLLINFWFETNFYGGSLCTGGVAGTRAVVNLSSTDYGEIIIFGLSKDQTIRNWSTLMDLEKNLILVIYLISSLFFHSCNTFSYFSTRGFTWGP